MTARYTTTATAPEPIASTLVTADPYLTSSSYARSGKCLFAAVVVICAVLTAAVCACIYRHRRRGGETKAETYTVGLDKRALASLPIGRAQSKEVAECAVCLCALEQGGWARTLPGCGHTFHPRCIDVWLGSHTTCPLCRSFVVVAATPEPPAVATPSGLPDGRANLV